MTKAEAFKEINDTQEFYINELIDTILNSKNNCLKTINFTSPTGTGKTNMMSLLCNKLSDYYFVITTLSKGQLHIQVKNNMTKLVQQDNFVVYGLCDFTANTKLQANEILSKLPKDKKIIWLRDEGHINTNKWQELINNACFKIINISATNKEETGIRCNFTNTMMLRTVNQNIGTPEDALDKLLEVKKQHKKVSHYNPCAIMRCLDVEIEKQIIKACEERGLKYINITTEDFDMSDLCKDDNEYDVILNKFKIVEGIDIRRAHVVYMTNEPSNVSTTIQIIGRCRRNALLYRNDIDIFDYKNKTLLNNTRQCFVFYNVENMNIDQDENGELCQAFCDTISCQELKANSIIHVEDGQLDNGLHIIELAHETGDYRVEIDNDTGFNIIKPEGNFYRSQISTITQDNSISFTFNHGYVGEEIIYLTKDFIKKHFEKIERTKFNYATGQSEIVGYDYIPFRNYEFKLTFTLDDVDTLINKISANKLTKNYVDNYVNDFINKLDHLDTSSWIRKTPTKYAIDLCLPTITHVPTSLCINENRIKEFSFSHDISAFISSEQHLESTQVLERRYVSSYDKAVQLIKDKIDELKKNARNIAINNNKINLTISCACLPKGTDLVYNELICINDRQHLFNYLNKCNKTYKFIIDVFNEEVVRDRKTYRYFLNTRALKKIIVHDFELESIYFNYKKIVNDRESAIIGTDLLKRVKDDKGNTIWIEDRAVTGKISRYTKFNTFIQNKYAKELNEAKSLTFSGKNNFKFDSKCNSCLGYCVEYYSKYLVYGEAYLGSFLNEALKESKATELNDFLVVRACMLKYRDNMMSAYRGAVCKVIKTISTSQLIQAKYKEFVNTVVKLGTKTARFVKEKMNISKPLEAGDKLYDPNLSIKHIAGLADYINEDTIIDIKTTNSININYIKQVLAYHYLSTKRSDLHIKRVIVYDAVSDRSVEVNL